MEISLESEVAYLMTTMPKRTFVLLPLKGTGRSGKKTALIMQFTCEKLVTDPWLRRTT